MITLTAEQIERELNLTGVMLTTEGDGTSWISANEEVTPETNKLINLWMLHGSLDAARWNVFLEGVISDAVTGISLKASVEARDTFTGQITLIREALDAGVLSLDSPMPIWDAFNNRHDLTVAQVRGLLLRYGMAWQQAFNELAP